MDRWLSNGSTFAIPLCLNTSLDVVFVSVVIILNYFHIWQILHTFKLQIICTIGLKSFPKQSMLIPIQLLYSLISTNCAHVELCVTLCLDTCALYTDAHRYTHTQTDTHMFSMYVASTTYARTARTHRPGSHSPWCAQSVQWVRWPTGDISSLVGRCAPNHQELLLLFFLF